MNPTFSFCICSDGTNDDRLHQIIDSIEAQHIPDYEIIICCANIERENTIIITFDELQKQGWITRKKNLMADQASKNYCVFLHDYFHFFPGWYEGWKNFLAKNSLMEIGVDNIITLEGPRHSGWCVDPTLLWETIPESKGSYDVMLPYQYKGLTKIQYISGGYWVSTTKFARENPQIEELGWGEYEDTRWSARIRQKTEFYVNPNSTTQILKPGKWQPNYIPQEWFDIMCEKHNTTLKIES